MGHSPVPDRGVPRRLFEAVHVRQIGPGLISAHTDTDVDEGARGHYTEKGQRRRPTRARFEFASHPEGAALRFRSDTAAVPQRACTCTGAGAGLNGSSIGSL